MRTVTPLLLAIFGLAACTCPPPQTAGPQGPSDPVVQPAPVEPATPVEPAPVEPPAEPTEPPPPQPPPVEPTPAEPAQTPLPPQGMACTDGGKCAEGLTCLEYYGIAGPRGPKFTSCEIPCRGGAPCPAGQACTTIADGPGQVCRPKP